MPPSLEKLREKPYITLGVGVVISCFSVALGIGLMSASEKAGSQLPINYTNVTKCDAKNQNLTCPEIVANSSVTSCLCYMPIEVKEDLKAPISMYYELPDFDFASIAKSRDDVQLSGNLSGKPADACGQYSFDNGKPIAPCGALANALFIDKYHIRPREVTEWYPIRVGLLSAQEKIAYHNPPGDLMQAFQNYSKPINWTAIIWTQFLQDPFGPENSAFQNERFIGFMSTDLTRKPYGILAVNNDTSAPLTKGNYFIQFEYNTLNYTGRRILILSSPAETNSLMFGFGVALLVIGLTALAVCGYLVIRTMKEAVKKAEANNPEASRMRDSEN